MKAVPATVEARRSVVECRLWILNEKRIENEKMLPLLRIESLIGLFSFSRIESNCKGLKCVTQASHASASDSIASAPFRTFNFTWKQMNGNSNNNTFCLHSIIPSISFSATQWRKWHSGMGCVRDNAGAMDEIHINEIRWLRWCQTLISSYYYYSTATATAVAAPARFDVCFFFAGIDRIILPRPMNDILISLNVADKIVLFVFRESERRRHRHRRRRLANRISHRVKSIPA